MSSTIAKPRIIVVDDSKLMRASLKNVLKEEFEISEAYDGEQGWEMLCGDSTIQVVITDAQMPKLDGYGLIQRIRHSELPHVRDIPVIMITGADDESARARALETGATDFVTKPFDKTQLLARTRTHAKLDQTTRKLAQTSEALAEHSAVDALTGISSRRYFLERGTQDLAFAKRRGQDMVVINIAVDKFSALVRTHGEAVANKILVWIAKKLKETVRTEDTAARTGDTHFAILAATTGRMEAAVLCERTRKSIIAAPFMEGNIAIPLTISLGLSSLAYDKPDAIEKFLGIAEQRAQRAQTEGGNRMIASDASEKKPQPLKEPVPTLDLALQLLATRSMDKLGPHLVYLCLRALPLLDAANQRLNLGIAEPLSAIREKLEKRGNR